MSYIGVQPFGQTVRTVTTITATASQTTFSPNGGYTVGYCDVYYNGIKLVEGQDYNASNGTTVVLTTGATANAVVDIVTYGTVTITDAVRRSGDTFAGAVAINSTLAAGNTTITGTANVSQGLTANTLTTTANTLTIGTAAYHVANGNFGIGMSSPVYKLEVSAAASGIKINTTAATATNPGLDLLDGSVDAIFSASNSQSTVYFGAYSNHPLVFNTNNTERMRINSAGKVGIGAAPAAWENSTNSAVLQVRNSSFFDYIGAQLDVGLNTYFDGTDYRRITTSSASRASQSGGAHWWSTATSGSGGSTLTWTETMRIDSSGRVTKPLQPAFKVTKTNGSGSSGSSTVIIFNQVNTNIGSHYNASTGLFTAPVAGMYQFNFSGITNNANTDLTIDVNGSAVAWTYCFFSAQYANMSMSTITYMNAGDSARVYVRTGNLYDGGDGGAARFSGFLIG